MLKYLEYCFNICMELFVKFSDDSDNFIGSPLVRINFYIKSNLVYHICAFAANIHNTRSNRCT